MQLMLRTFAMLGLFTLGTVSSAEAQVCHGEGDGYPDPGEAIHCYGATGILHGAIGVESVTHDYARVRFWSAYGRDSCANTLVCEGRADGEYFGPYPPGRSEERDLEELEARPRGRQEPRQTFNPTGRRASRFDSKVLAPARHCVLLPTGPAT